VIHLSRRLGRDVWSNESIDPNLLFGWKDAFRGIFFFALECQGCDDSRQRRWLVGG